MDCPEASGHLNVPQLQHAGGLLGYVQRQLGLPVASTAPLARITDRFAAAVHRFAEQEQVPWVDFARGQRKDDVMHEHLAAFQAAGRTEGILFIGRAQEKTPLFRTEKRRDREGKSYPWIVKTTGVVNHFYFYCVDSDFGPFFLKFCSYFPYNAKLCLNGNHWAQQQAAIQQRGRPRPRDHQPRQHIHQRRRHRHRTRGHRAARRSADEHERDRRARSHSDSHARAVGRHQGARGQSQDHQAARREHEAAHRSATTRRGDQDVRAAQGQTQARCVRHDRTQAQPHASSSAPRQVHRHRTRPQRQLSEVPVPTPEQPRSPTGDHGASAYEPPRLTPLGSVEQLTRGGNVGTEADGFGFAGASGTIS